MSHPAGSFTAVSVQAGSEAPNPAGQAPGRWRLSRAGIVNVYQYENEVLHFGGGRLLLRGVNGSGKSTAMNMLLPFLLTARQGKIDAAGEQVGILKSWMLSGRDDAQPVGYLWIEFERRGEYLTCGCGIKANRQSDRVTTWWFVTAKRPGVDFDLVGSGNIPLTADGLRATLDDSEVYSERQRRDYRRRIELRLFGGASIEQHVELIHLVRSPRVGDRIDVDLPRHLADALPQLSEEALAEAAQPLDDLEEHRRNVAELERTAAAIDGLLEVYRTYCTGDLRGRLAAGREQLESLRRRSRDEKAKYAAAGEAGAEVGRLDGEIARLEGEAKRLRNEISALEESEVYSSGLQLVALADLVKDLDRQRTKAGERVVHGDRRIAAETTGVKEAQGRCRDDLERLNEDLAAAAGLAEHCGLARHPPGPARLSEASLDGLEAAEPAEAFDGAALERTLKGAGGALTQRRGDLTEVTQARRRLDEAVERQSHADSMLDSAVAAAHSATARLAERTRALARTRNEWIGRVREWAALIRPLLQAAGVEAPAVDGLAVTEAPVTGDHEDLRAELLTAGSALVTARLNASAALQHRLKDERAATSEAQAVVDELAVRTEPDPPRFAWQAAADHCLADLIDFAPELDDARRAGLEAALEASGLLAARLVESGGAELANGELVAVAAGGVPSPLSDLLSVTVPDQLIGVVDAGLVGKLLDSISSDPSTGAATAAGADGNFRVGALEGRHRKKRAEFIGVTARREALARERRAAAEALQRALAAVARSEAELSDLNDLLTEARRLQSELPGTAEIAAAAGAVEEATATAEEAETARQNAAERAEEAERAAGAASDELRRRAVTLGLPADGEGLASFGADLNELGTILDRCRSRTSAIARSVEGWSEAVARWRSATEEQRNERADLARITEEHDRQYDRLMTIERSIGEEYQRLVAERDRRRTELDAAETRLPSVRSDRDAAVGQRAQAEADAKVAAQRRVEAEQACEELRLSLERVLATPGLVEAVAPSLGEHPAEPIVSPRGGAEGLGELLGGIRQLLPTGPNVGAPDAGSADVNSVHQSLRQRRDALGAGWDAEARQVDLSLPLVVEVAGPAGRAPLAKAARAVSEQHSQLASLLDRKQSDALRELLQGLIARELAEKVHGAGEFVELMNGRLASVATAHDVGVRLRWRRSPELDASTARMVELLATRPDLRLDEDEQELRSLLSERLNEARSLQPDVPYRQLIAGTLDYKQWHEMAVMVRRDGDKEARLGRRTPLSEGEKKIVTYLSLFAAVAASHDALAAQHQGPEQDRPGIARLVLLDDAFAKVSEDNHAALFGLLVDLDLDLIATSERLWGTHASVPQLAITEVIRDADLRTILLEHYRWDGTTLARQEAS